jgi:hypothetical protein
VKPTELYDRFGRVIGRGDLIMIPGEDPVIWQVAEVKVDLTPRVDGPQNVTMIKLVLMATRSHLATGGAPIAEFVKCADYTETDLYRQEQAAGKQGES